jgi:hypothetical protein
LAGRFILLDKIQIFFSKGILVMSFITNRVDESYLQRLIDDLQQDHNTLFNSLKNGSAEKEKLKLKNKKVDKHTNLIAKLMNSALLLKQLLEEVKKVK